MWVRHMQDVVSYVPRQRLSHGSDYRHVCTPTHNRQHNRWRIKKQDQNCCGNWNWRVWKSTLWLKHMNVNNGCLKPGYNLTEAHMQWLVFILRSLICSPGGPFDDGERPLGDPRHDSCWGYGPRQNAETSRCVCVWWGGGFGGVISKYLPIALKVKFFRLLLGFVKETCL